MPSQRIQNQYPNRRLNGGTGQLRLHQRSKHNHQQQHPLKQLILTSPLFSIHLLHQTHQIIKTNQKIDIQLEQRAVIKEQIHNVTLGYYKNVIPVEVRDER